MERSEQIKLKIFPGELSNLSILVTVYLLTNNEYRLHHYRGEEVWQYDGNLDQLKKYTNFLSNTIIGNSVSDFSNCTIHLEDYEVSPRLLKDLLIELLPAKAIFIARIESSKHLGGTVEKESESILCNKEKIEILKKLAKDYDISATNNLRQKKSIEFQQQNDILNNSILIVANVDNFVFRWRHESGKKVNSKLRVFKNEVLGIDNDEFFPEEGVFYKIVDDKEYVYSGTIIGIIYHGSNTLENIEYEIGHLRKINVIIWNKKSKYNYFLLEERIASVHYISVKNIDCHESQLKKLK